jgi:hypothetical protein
MGKFCINRANPKEAALSSSNISGTSFAIHDNYLVHAQENEVFTNQVPSTKVLYYHLPTPVHVFPTSPFTMVRIIIYEYLGQRDTVDHAGVVCILVC